MSFFIGSLQSMVFINKTAGSKKDNVLFVLKYMPCTFCSLGRFAKKLYSIMFAGNRIARETE